MMLQWRKCIAGIQVYRRLLVLLSVFYLFGLRHIGGGLARIEEKWAHARHSIVAYEIGNFTLSPMSANVSAVGDCFFLFDMELGHQ